MVVLRPMFEGEYVLHCKCGHVGLGSPILERTSFYKDRTRTYGLGYRCKCRRCSCSSARKWERANPDQHRRRARAWREENRERIAEERQIDRCLKREKEGKWKPPPAEHNIRGRVKPSGVLLPAEPMNLWVEDLLVQSRKAFQAAGELDSLVEQKAALAVRQKLGINSRRMWSLRTAELDHVDVLTVDQIVTYHGGVTIEEIYRDYGGYTIAEDWTCTKTGESEE